MREIKNVLICGLGAVGMTFACKIQKALPECLKVLVDTERLHRYSKNPPKMNGEEKFFDYVLPYETGPRDFRDKEHERKSGVAYETAQPRTARGSARREVAENCFIGYKADLVIISTKMDGLDAVLENLRNFVDENTIILPILNGIEAEERVARVYGWERTLYGYFICHSAMRVSNEVVQDGVCKVVFGSKTREKDGLVRSFFTRAGVEFDNPENIIYAKWLKFALNVVSNQLSCILKMTFGDMQKSERFRELARNIVREVMTIAEAEGVEGWQNLEQDFTKMLAMMSENGKTSMWQDVEAGKKTELDIFAGTVLKLGAKHGISTPYNKVMYEMIRIIEEKF